MKNLFATVFAAVPLLSASVALAQGAGMMNGGGGMGGFGRMGGYGGVLLTILFVVVLAGLVMWFVKQKGK